MKSFTARMLPYAVVTTLSLLAAASDVRAADLTVTVEGARSTDGEVLFALYDTAEAFPSNDRRRDAQKVAAGPGAIVAVFRDLPAGRYAVAVVHDANGNGKLDRNLVGMPIEGYGFSNDAMGIAAPPSFDKAAVDVTGDRAITIKLR